MATLQRQRSIITSVVELVDGFLARLPGQPATFFWSGEAQRQYVRELEALRDTMWNLRSHSEATLVRLDQLAVAHVCG